jgi:hypothetical protein
MVIELNSTRIGGDKRQHHYLPAAIPHKRPLPCVVSLWNSSIAAQNRGQWIVGNMIMKIAVINIAVAINIVQVAVTFIQSRAAFLKTINTKTIKGQAQQGSVTGNGLLSHRATWVLVVMIDSGWVGVAVAGIKHFGLYGYLAFGRAGTV